MGRMVKILDQVDGPKPNSPYLQLKGLVAKGFLTPQYDHNATKTSSKLFIVSEFARAILMLDALDGKWEGDRMHNLQFVLYSRISKVLADLKNAPGANWVLFFECWRTSEKHPTWLIYLRESSAVDDETDVFKEGRLVMSGQMDVTDRLRKFKEWVI
jgi:hypothetical protein